MRFASIAIVVVAGCYNPKDVSCVVACDVANPASCPGSLVCSPTTHLCGETTTSCAAQPDGGGVRDGDVDGNTVVECQSGETELGRGPVKLCIDANNVDQQFTLMATTVINTDVACDFTPLFNGVVLCVRVAKTVALGGTIRVEGSRPWVLVATVGGITISDNTKIDASTKTLVGMPGAGANSPITDCSAAEGLPANGAIGAGGGAGGRFQGASGGGAAGTDAQSASTSGATADPSFRFRAGCRGGKGANTPTAGGGGGGLPGGAIYFIASSTISAGNSVEIGASGGGGGQAFAQAGGGGGGSGGFIGFDAPTYSFTMNVFLFALGGGGSSGGDPAGQGGFGGEAPNPDTPANGGGAMCAGSGGPGSSRTSGGGDGMVPNCGVQAAGGGGGGGGSGYIGFVEGNGIPTVFQSAPAPPILTITPN